MSSPSEQSTLGLRLIGALKLGTALMLGAAGFGIFRLLNHDLGKVVEDFALRLHLDPDSRLIHAVLDRVDGINRGQLEALGLGTYFYALLEFVEGVGLLLKRRWAEYLTILATVLLLPLEFYELAHKVNRFRVMILLANLAILVYLIFKLRRKEGHSTKLGAGTPSESP
ncbi:Uncharacterized membrane protein, DUF2068 family [Singulisphaera sp. GP187]|uniref:DUF2127 domain-containing protein n=1 Tax=Singulisphaera sp. GP187 TaxID=1882752 RepID=UPI000927660A|nr:DUF2127 domain-containing protein [Singulisphaera sp. GP187]SIO58163.1 Uncharacterized membrane protein, DUF2068 family [Singulisphaera sp. GP187]